MMPVSTSRESIASAFTVFVRTSLRFLLMDVRCRLQEKFDIIQLGMYGKVNTNIP